MEIRLEHERDRPAVRIVHLEAFRDEGRVAGLVVDLRDAVSDSEGLSLVADDGATIVGHVMFTPGLLDAPRRLVPVQVLSPVGVVPASQRQGVGSELIRRGLEILAERSVPAVFVEGPPAYYARFRFEPGADHGFRKPSLRIPDAAFQAVRLASYEPWMTGTLVYSEPFWRHDAVGLRDLDE